MVLRRKLDTLDTLHQFIGAKSLEAKRQYNKHGVAIHRLPLEVLAISLYLDIRGRWENEESLRDRRMQLSKVCFYWSQVLVSFPQLWGDLSHEQGDVRIALARSKATSLSIACRVTFLDRSERAIVERFLQLASGHSDRWCAVWFKVFHTARTVGRCLELPTPKLKDISVVFESHTTAHHYINLHPDGSTLRHVNLERTRLPWESDRLRNLRSLELRQLENGLPSLVDLQAVLRTSPLLERLALCDMKGDVGDEPRDHNPIHLRSLRSFLIGRVPSALTEFIIRAIHPERLSSLIVLDSKHSHFDVVGPYAHLFRLGMPLLRTGCSFYLAQKSDGKVVLNSLDVSSDRWKPWPYQTKGTENAGVWLEFEKETASAALTAAAAFLTSSGTSAPLIVTLEHRPIPNPEIPSEVNSSLTDFMTTLTHIQGLAVEDLRSAKTIITYLATSQLNDEGDIKWPNTDLMYLSLREVKGLTASDIMLLEDRFIEYCFHVRLPAYLEGVVSVSYRGGEVEEIALRDMAYGWMN